MGFHKIFCLALFSFSVTLIYGQVEIFPYVENGKIGYRKHSDSSVVIPPKLDYIEEFIPGYSWTVIGQGEFDLLSSRIDKREVRFTGKFGFINNKGNFIFPPVFDMVISFFPEYALIGDGEGHFDFGDFPDDKSISFKGKLGLVNRNGNLLMYPEYDLIRKVRHAEKSYWFAKKEETSFLFKDSVNLNINKKIEEIEDFSEGLARFRIDEAYGFLDDRGKIAIKPVFNKAGQFKEGKTLVKREGRFFYIDPSGKKIPGEPVKFDNIDIFSEGYARVEIMDEFGYIEPDSSYYIYPQYSEATSFFNGLAFVSNEESFGYIFTDNRTDLVGRYENEPFTSEVLYDKMPVVLKNLDSVGCTSGKNALFFNSFSYLDLSEFSRITLEAIRWALYQQKNFSNIFAKAAADEGTLAGRSFFTIDCISARNPAWEKFKKRTLLKIIAEPALREIAWTWIKPFLVKSFSSMPEIHQKVYREMLDYLEQYYSDYNLSNVKKFLSEHEEEFAYYHSDGSTSPYRKTSALIDRLILIYQVLLPEEVLQWISRIKNELNISQ